MLNIFYGLKRIVKFKSIQTDNNIFRLHYKVTTIVLLIFCLVVTSTQYIGDPIKCYTTFSDQVALETYCWITSTYIVLKDFDVRNRISPGVGPEIKGEDDIKINKYYQWVCFTLFFQAILFYVPRYVWKIWEGGRLKILASDLKFASINPDNMHNKCTWLCDYFIIHMCTNNIYFYKYFFCEILNLVNVIGQIFVIDLFLDGSFLTYGFDAITYMNMDAPVRNDPISYIFPINAKCDFPLYGPTGTKINKDAVCVLPLNVVNEKIYFIMWFWFFILFFVTFLGIIYRIVVIYSPFSRYLLMKSKLRMFPPQNIEYVCQKMKIGDWFFLFQLSNNVDLILFKHLVEMLTVRLQSKDRNTQLPSTILEITNSIDKIKV